MADRHLYRAEQFRLGDDLDDFDDRLEQEQRLDPTVKRGTLQRRMIVWAMETMPLGWEIESSWREALRVQEATKPKRPK